MEFVVVVVRCVVAVISSVEERRDRGRHERVHAPGVAWKVRVGTVLAAIKRRFLLIAAPSID